MDQITRLEGRPLVGAPIPFARTSVLTPFLNFLNTIGAPTERMLHQAHVPSMPLNDPEGLVSVFSGYRFFELAVCQERVEDLGRIVGQRVSSFELGAYGQALLSASTVYEYLKTGIQLIGSLSGGTRLWMSADGENIRVNQYLAGPAGVGRCVADVYTLVVTLSTLRQIIGKDWSPGEVRLLAGDEAFLGSGESLADAPIITGQRHTSFTVPRSLLKLPLTRNRGGASAFNSAPSGADPMPGDFMASIEQLIVSQISDGYPSIQVVGEAAGMSSRTLQRRLSEAGKTYTGLVTASRMRIAKDWLVFTDMPIAEMAATLGYTDTSNFTRAFRREAGMSPRSYRRCQTEV